MNKIIKTIGIVAGAAGLIAAGAYGAVSYMGNVASCEPIYIEHNNTIIKEVEKVVNVTVEVPVDNEKLGTVLDFVYDNDGDIEYIVDDLDNDEVQEIADRIVFINDAKSISVKAVEDDLFDELDREVYNISGEDIKFDDDDMERLHIDDEFDEIIVDDVDFDDNDVDTIVTGSFEQDDVKYDFEAVVKIRDGEYDELGKIKVLKH